MSTITVHDFVPVGGASTSRSALQLQQGRDLVLACSSSHRWVTPKSTIDTSVFALRHDRLYQYRLDPPPSTTNARHSICMPEWDRPLQMDDPEHFRLQDLQEFENADFQASGMCSKIGRVASSRRGKRTQNDNYLSIDAPAKRFRLDAVNILELIPQPHFIPAPAGTFKPVDTQKIPHYSKAVPSPIAPYDAAAVNHLLSCRFRRVGWLIPVCGNLSWGGASTAMILEETQVASRSPSPCPSVSGAQTSTITWTPNSLQHFWTFLESIQHARHLGPLSLSFHTASLDVISARATASEPIWESNHPYHHQHSPMHTSSSSDDFAAEICRTRLEDIDYIKIYHDVPYSLSLRNILDAYKYEPNDGQAPSQSGANDRKIRILKGVRLVLTDERSKAAFLM